MFRASQLPHHFGATLWIVVGAERAGGVTRRCAPDGRRPRGCPGTAGRSSIRLIKHAGPSGALLDVLPHDAASLAPAAESEWE